MCLCVIVHLKVVVSQSLCSNSRKKKNAIYIFQILEKLYNLKYFLLYPPYFYTFRNTILLFSTILYLHSRLHIVLDINSNLHTPFCMRKKKLKMNIIALNKYLLLTRTFFCSSCTVLIVLFSLKMEYMKYILHLSYIEVF